jgi:hypothetical protein
MGVMTFVKGKSGNPKGSVRGKKRSQKGSGTWRRDLLWSYKHMGDEPGTEGRAPSGGAKALLREARENPSKFLDRVEKVLQAGKEKAAEQDEPISAQDQHYGEIIDRLLKEFADGQPGAVGSGGPPRPGRKPQVQAVR